MHTHWYAILAPFIYIHIYTYTYVHMHTYWFAILAPFDDRCALPCRLAL